ncbi:hypothetical protein Dsin_015126 [Dipteronia sinensis]|uniref:Peptidase C14 caspase domain-containing protein n=1 Tax=Dipteronia sinensis TaxID=43782 RepID=A0AAE0AN30_9ROSI|nr:hypothetical protein Dsin_015126 [Dipteronia sinensis]
MKEVLIERFRFEPSGIELLTDATRPRSNLVMPTGANIMAALKRMVDGAEAGDVLFFHYSGHGSRIPSIKPGCPFRQDEAIVSTDFQSHHRFGLQATSESPTKGHKLHNPFIFMPRWRPY